MFAEAVLPTKDPIPSLATWTTDDALDILEMTALHARTWTFVWPGRVVVQPLTEGVVFTPVGEPQIIPIGCVLTAEASAAQLRITAAPGASFRVIFEAPSESSKATAPFSRVAAPRLRAVHSTPSARDLFRQAFQARNEAQPDSWRLSPAVARTRQYIEQNADADFDLEDLSALAGVDRCHLCRVFQRAMGVSPSRYRAHLRIARARTMLAAGLDCTEVAYAVGFCDQSHFSRCFKELTGTTPGSYARAHRSRITNGGALSRAA